MLVTQNGGNLFDKIQQAGVDKDQIFKLADSVKDANFKDEETVRQLIQQVSSIAGKPVSKDKEEQIVKAITTNNIPVDLASISNLFK